MNHGAAQATGDILLFLHADCSLEPGALDAAEYCLRQRGVAAGCFRMSVPASGLLYRLIGPSENLRREIMHTVGDLAKVEFTLEIPFVRLRVPEPVSRLTLTWEGR